METNEIIALSIVVLAAFLALRHFLYRKDSGCCGTGCLPKFEKKDPPQSPDAHDKK